MIYKAHLSGKPDQGAYTQKENSWRKYDNKQNIRVTMSNQADMG